MTRVFLCIFGIVALAMMVACGGAGLSPSVQVKAPPENSAVIPADVSYTVIRTNTIPGIKRALTVTINRRVSNEILQAIAMKLKAGDSEEYKRTLITYFLSGNEDTHRPWAATDFNPDLEVRVWGFSDGEEKMLRSVALEPGSVVIGAWLDETSGSLSRRIILYRRDGKAYRKETFKDASGATEEMIETTTPDGERFDDRTPYAANKRAGTHWLIDHSGNLQERDNQETFLTPKKFQIDVVYRAGAESPKQAKPLTTGKQLVVSLTVETTILDDKRVVVSGKTNLPQDTILAISVQDALEKRNPAVTETKVMSDGTYKSKALGARSGLEDGEHVADVTMPFAFLQPAAVQKIIGEKGQNLSGPLVDTHEEEAGTKKNPFGNTIWATKRFSIP